LEAVEDGFLLRNYGTDSGELYKPDSMGGKDVGREGLDVRSNVIPPPGREKPPKLRTATTSMLSQRLKIFPKVPI
jgi:hypothetical protein